ncbi:aminomethyl-transferring glycine dehydrogenase subunit GcvPA [Candidatus Marinimicrobia bacterium MT.SAG.3]|nr:aminomethyl-transferring glycine dehydrogenase subunit GcvPA [Candidatus Marinimicrobia bacterium MT.SAG.3]
MTLEESFHLIPNTDEERKEMLSAIGVENFEELLSNVPAEFLEVDFEEIGKGLSEYEVMKLLSDLANQNVHTGEAISFLGGGSYDHFIPSIIGEIISRSEYLTAYTPYQPEVAQGTLQAIFEYQSMICALTGMDVANASMYDGASALAEAGLLAVNQKKRNKLVIASTVNPTHRAVVKTYLQGADVELVTVPQIDGVTDLKTLSDLVDSDTAGLLLQTPNFFGCIEDADEMAKIAHDNDALFIVSADPISLGILKKPGESGADIVVGEGQSLGSPTQFGGPYLGIFAAKMELVRRMPGRIAGQTWDVDGKRGFVLTLQTREQHIRRERATSNICTNQGIVMLSAAIYMALMGKEGISSVAELSTRKSHYLAEKINDLKGYELMFSAPFFKEFVVKTPVTPSKLIKSLLDEKIFAGIDLSSYDYGLENCMLVCVTEKRTKEEMDKFVDSLSKVS